MKKTPFVNKTVTLIAFGANGGTCVSVNQRRILAARRALQTRFPGVWHHARLWGSPAWPIGSGPDFVNSVSLLERVLPSDLVLRQLHALEARAGRVRGKRWGARVLDLDLLAVADHVRPSTKVLHEWLTLPDDQQAARTPDQLLLPHPRLQDRAFVLGPLCDVAPLWRHPITGQSAQSMWRALPASRRHGVKPM